MVTTIPSPRLRDPRPTRRRLGRRAAAWQTTARAVAAVEVVVLGTNVLVYGDLSLGGVLALALAPVWLPHARRYSGAATLGILVVACCVSGPLLTAWASSDHGIVHAGTRNALFSVVSVAAGTGALLWARQVLSVRL